MKHIEWTEAIKSPYDQEELDIEERYPDYSVKEFLESVGKKYKNEHCKYY